MGTSDLNPQGKPFSGSMRGGAGEPLVSIFCFCKDRAGSIRRCIESVLSQTYTNFEFVIQDGASTDGTLEIIRSFEDSRIKLVSQPDAGPNEAFLKVMRRCRGEIVGSCLSDEELLPDAIKEAVELFRQHPRVGAITRDGYNTDADGRITSEFIAGDFDFVDYLFGRYCPMWVASFFRRQALVDIGLEEDGWEMDCIEFETWCRLATRSTVKYVPGIVAKYALNAQGQLSNSPEHFKVHLDARTAIIEKLFSEDGFFGDEKIKKIGCLYNQNFLFYNHTRAYGMHAEMTSIYARIMELERHLQPTERNEYRVYFSDFGATSALDSELVMKHWRAVHSKTSEMWIRASTKVPRSVKDLLTQDQRATVRRAVLRMLYTLNQLLHLAKHYLKTAAAGQPVPKQDDGTYALATPVYFRRIYHDVAMLYYGRGNIDYAQHLWRKAEALNDVTIDSLAIQAMLFSPTATNASLLVGQQRWAERHAKPIAGIEFPQLRPYRRDRKIRVGYFCSFMDSDVFRAMFAPVARAHDRSGVDVIAYSVTPLAQDLEASFDRLSVTGTMSDAEFVKRVRQDEIDIFVEMSGFSPMHRFAAMASRCAPIQIAHFNHSGTCGVPNVDYVFADAMSVPPEDEKYFSEKVWRLEGDFLFFNYEWANLPEPRDPPCVKNGHVTFGCFGSAGKLSDELIELWAMVLNAVPNSRMYIRNSPLGRQVNRDYLAQRFRRHGIDNSRLWLDGATDWRKFIASYKHIDISLDTWPYCGANTVGESVWQGVPVITLRGNRFSGRYGSSHAAAAGTPELIADTPERYLEIAADLAADPERVTHYRRNLRRMAYENGLSDAPRFARKLEKAYVEMMNLLHAGTH